jgi:hypothetical protein
MQTAVTTFQRTRTDRTISAGTSTSGTGSSGSGYSETIELHAQLHFGEHQYFDAYNARSFNVARDAVLYELLLDEDLLETETDTGEDDDSRSGVGVRRLLPNRDGSSPVTASPTDQQMALQYGWSCQVNVMDYSQPNWIQTTDSPAWEPMHQNLLFGITESKTKPFDFVVRDKRDII